VFFPSEKEIQGMRKRKGLTPRQIRTRVRAAVQASRDAREASLYDETRLATFAARDAWAILGLREAEDEAMADQILMRREILSGKSYAILKQQVELGVRMAFSFQEPRDSCRLARQFLGLSMQDAASRCNLGQPNDVREDDLDAYLGALFDVPFGGTARDRYYLTARAKRYLRHYAS
jgi:hypothetical protein